jgi:phage terminase large subunit-like protein
MFSQSVDRAKRINEGMIKDDSFAGFVFTVPDHDLDGNEIDPFDEAVWMLANPGLGTILSLKDIRDWAKRAKEMPSLQNKFENLKLNRRVSETQALFSRTSWASNSDSFNLKDLEGLRCTLGLDLSETTDLTSLVALFDPDEVTNGKSAVLPFFFIPGNGLQERSRRDKVPYDVWAKDGLIDVSSSNTVDYSLVAKKMLWIMEFFEVEGVGFDRWKMKYLIKALEDEGFELDEEERKEFFIEVGQGFKGHTRGIEVLEGLVVNSRLAHGNNPILTWNAANAVTIKDPSGSRKIEKSKSFGRVDGIIALMNAAYAKGEMEFNEGGESDYEKEDFEM